MPYDAISSPNILPAGSTASAPPSVPRIVAERSSNSPLSLQIYTADDMKTLVSTYLRTHKTSYVHVSSITKTGSGLVFLVCCVSLLTGALTKFELIHPLFAIVFLVWSAAFFWMGDILAKRQNDDL